MHLAWHVHKMVAREKKSLGKKGQALINDASGYNIPSVSRESLSDDFKYVTQSYAQINVTLNCVKRFVNKIIQLLIY